METGTAAGATNGYVWPEDSVQQSTKQMKIFNILK